MKTTRKQNLLAVALVAAVAFATSGTQAQDITPAEARVIAQEAYIYFYPLVIMDVSRKHFTNIEEGKMFARGPMNTFAHARTFPPATFRGATHANFDTLYSVGWLDLTKEPVVISVPDTQGRYYLLQLLDMWTDSFAGVGKRTTGLAPRTYLDKMLKEPFATFTFSPAGAAVYHLGHFGTAAKKLHEFTPPSC